MFPTTDRRAAIALLILRFFLGIFLLEWSVEKLILPSATARIAQSFYGMPLPIEASYALGIAELILSRGFCLVRIGPSVTAYRSSCTQSRRRSAGVS